MQTGVRRARRRFRAVMVAAVALAVLPSVVVLVYTGVWMGPGRQVLFLGLAGALAYTGATWARWGLSLWFGVTGLTFLLAAFVAAALSARPWTETVGPQVLVGVLYLGFAAIFARSVGMDEWLESRRRARDAPDRSSR